MIPNYHKEVKMTPVIRIDDEVMDELKKRAIHLGLIFGTPNEVLRSILKLDKQGNLDKQVHKEFGRTADIRIGNASTALLYPRIPTPKVIRHFFPGYKIPFVLETDAGEIRTHVTSALKGTPIGDPERGNYIRSGLRNWFEAHQAQILNGGILHIEALEPGKRYKLSIVSKSV